MQNLLLSYLTRRMRASLAGGLLLLSVLWAPVLADSVTITRIGPCDWICADDQSFQLSCHTRVDKAIEACTNRSLADGLQYRVIPAQYRLIATIDADTTPVLGSVTLSWTAPTQNEDGTILTDLAGYKLYWGTESGVYTESIDVPDPAATTFIVEDLAPNTYHFAATAYNAAGAESAYSVEAIKEVP